jgi:hypothetical protein
MTYYLWCRDTITGTWMRASNARADTFVGALQLAGHCHRSYPDCQFVVRSEDQHPGDCE